MTIPYHRKPIGSLDPFAHMTSPPPCSCSRVFFCLCFQSSFSSEIAGIRYHDLARGGRWTLRFLVTLDLTAFFRGTEPIVRVYWYGSPNETKITISANHHLKLPFHRNLTFVEVTLFQNKKSPNKFNLTMFGPLPNHHFATWLRIATWATKKNKNKPLTFHWFLVVS